MMSNGATGRYQQLSIHVPTSAVSENHQLFMFEKKTIPSMQDQYSTPGDHPTPFNRLESLRVKMQEFANNGYNYHDTSTLAEEHGKP